MQVSDSFAAFQKIRGTPKFWQTVRSDLIAKVSQLGPFHIFFTLSCAEMRWSEVATSILQQGGHKIEFLSPWDGKPSNIFVNGTPLPEYLESHSVDKSNLLRNNVFLITRIFDHRVKSFIQHMVLRGGKGLLPVEYFTYRVEFQLRGMAHVHGCLWLEDSFVSDYKDPVDKTKFNEDKIGELIDQISSCKLPGTDDPELDTMVREVQVHKHTKSCKKYGSSCRFDFPHYPSPYTFVAQPHLDGENNELNQKYKERVQSTLKLVRDALESDFDDSLSLNDFLVSIGLTMQQYLDALSISTRASKIILKRSLAEVNVNNYNPEYLRAW
jgi:hypothetical protein